MSNDVKLAIKEDGIANLIVEITDIADEISIIFDEIDDSVSKIKEYLSCSANADIDTKYEEIRKNYQIIKNNVISYSNDLVSLNVKMHDGEIQMKNLFNVKTSEITDKIKEVN